MEINRITKKNLKEKYDVTCAVCGHEFWFAPSMLMGHGINSGHGTCVKCKTYLHLEIDENNDVGRSKKWEDYQREFYEKK